jgi:SAM-dependent methyltransferase
MNKIDYTSDDYHKSRHPEFFENQELSTAWSHFVKYTYFKDVDIVGKRILEYGGGLGYNLLELKKEADVSMIEPSNIGRELAEKSGIKSYSAASEIKNKQFDIILCRHVLEHISNPVEALNEMLSLLADKGILILILPFENQSIKVDIEDINHHLFCWNAQTIHNLTSLVGFETKRINFEYYDMRRKLLPLFRLCADKSEAVVRYTLSEDNEQIFASKYMLYLPTEQELKNEIYSVINE